MKEVKTLCPYCGVGCGLLVKTDGKTISSVRGDPSHPANFGRTCAKGATVAQTVNVKTRARSAMLRETRGAPRSVASNEDAIRFTARRLQTIRDEHGPASIAFY